MAAALDRLRVKLSTHLLYGVNTVVPGTPFSIKSPESKEERLPGMRRWVDRATLEEAFRAVDAGVPTEEAEAVAVNRGNILTPLKGAVAGGVLGRVFGGGYMTKDPVTNMILGALMGGAAGGVIHDVNRGDRRADFREALSGALTEAEKYPRPRTALPASRAAQSTATATTPLLLSTGPAT